MGTILLQNERDIRKTAKWKAVIHTEAAGVVHGRTVHRLRTQGWNPWIRGLNAVLPGMTSLKVIREP